MAKTPKLKKGAKQLSLHSRAARRGAKDATLNIDKSLLTCPLPSSSSSKSKNETSVLSAQPGSGVVKTNAKQRKESRRQRFRKEKELKKAEVMREKRERKVKMSLGKEVVGRERGVPWDEVNEKIGEEGKTTTTRGKKRRKGVESEAEKMDVDEDQDGSSDKRHGDRPAKSDDGAKVVEISPRVGEEEEKEEDEIL